VLEGKKGEAITIFCDDSRAQVGEAFEQGALKLGLETNLVVLPTDAKTMRTEITPDLTTYLTGKHANIYINLLRGTHEETPFRIKLIHAKPLTAKPASATPRRNLRHAHQRRPRVNRRRTPQNANLCHQPYGKTASCPKNQKNHPLRNSPYISVQNRPFFTDTMMDWKLMKWMNLPTGEVIVAPVEDSLKGTLVADMAVGGIGPLKAPVEIAVKKGRAQTILCDDPEVLQRIGNSLNTDAMAGIVGEFAFGINPKARLVEEFLETEKMQGTVHIAFGDNSDMPGGENHSGNHMDLMMAHPTVDAVSADGTVVRVLENGSF
jgi:hypothetical protein